MRRQAYLAGAVALALVSGAASQASAATTYFDPFSSNQGTSTGSDGFVPPNTWTWTSDNTWSYTGTYNPTGAYTGPADDFEISFVGGVQSIASAAGSDGTSGWTAATAGPSVVFSGASLKKGETFSFQVTLGGSPPVDAGLTATWSGTGSVVPETSTWAMLLAGFAGLGLAGFSGRRTAVSIA